MLTSDSKKYGHASTSTYALAHVAFFPSTEAAGDVILGLLLRRLGEDGIGVGEFDEFAEIHEGGKVGDARRLLHVVGDNNDCVAVR